MITEVVGKEIEKIKGDFESYLNGLNMVGEISYSQYSKLYDEGTKQIQRAYELGKTELEKENSELKDKLDNWVKCAELRLANWQKYEKENALLIQENEEMKKGLGCETCQITDKYKTLNNKIAELEKENAELVHENNRLVTIIEESKSSGISPLNFLIIKNLDMQLAQAKEIIKGFISFKIFSNSREFNNLLEQAEQFLEKVK